MFAQTPRKSPIGFAPQQAPNAKTTGTQPGSAAGPAAPYGQRQLPLGAAMPGGQVPPEQKLPTGIARGSSDRQRVVAALTALGWQILPYRAIEAQIEGGRKIVISKASPGFTNLLFKQSIGELGDYQFRVWNALTGTRGHARVFGVVSLATALDECLVKRTMEPFMKALSR